MPAISQVSDLEARYVYYTSDSGRVYFPTWAIAITCISIIIFLGCLICCCCAARTKRGVTPQSSAQPKMVYYGDHTAAPAYGAAGTTPVYSNNVYANDVAQGALAPPPPAYTPKNSSA